MELEYDSISDNVYSVKDAWEYLMRKGFRAVRDILVPLLQIRELLDRKLEVEDDCMNRKMVRLCDVLSIADLF